MNNGNSNGNNTQDKTKNTNGTMNIFGLIRVLVLVLLITIVAFIVIFVLLGVLNASTINTVDKSTKKTETQMRTLIQNEIDDDIEREKLVKSFFGLIKNGTKNSELNTENIMNVSKVLERDTNLTLELKQIVINNTAKIGTLTDYIRSLSETVTRNNITQTMEDNLTHS